jgi:hypothetical protein
MHPSREDISNASKLMRKWLDLHHQGHENSDAQEQLMKEVRVTLHKCPNLAPELNLPPCTDCTYLSQCYPIPPPYVTMI